MSVKDDIITSDKEKQLIDGCIAGDRNCQSALYEHFSPKMMIVCLRYAKNTEEAEEIIQDGFIRVFRFIHQYKYQGSFEGWIRKIMVNCALQKLRNNINLRIIVPLDTVEDTYGESYDMLEHMSGVEMLKMVQSLSPAYRIVFNLYHFEGLKHREISKLLNINIGTSKSNLAQAKRLLRFAINQKLKIAR